MVRLRQNLQRSQTRSIRISPADSSRNPDEQLQETERIWKKSWVRTRKEEILSQIQLKTEEQRSLKYIYKTVTEAEVLEKRMTELDS